MAPFGVKPYNFQFNFVFFSIYGIMSFSDLARYRDLRARNYKRHEYMVFRIKHKCCLLQAWIAYCYAKRDSLSGKLRKEKREKKLLKPLLRNPRQHEYLVIAPLSHDRVFYLSFVEHQAFCKLDSFP